MVLILPLNIVMPVAPHLDTTSFHGLYCYFRVAIITCNDRRAYAREFIDDPSKIQPQVDDAPCGSYRTLKLVTSI